MSALKQVVKSGSALFDRALPPPAGVTILIYHRIGGGSSSDVDLRVSDFEAQLAHLAANHEVISLDEAVDRLNPDPDGPAGTPDDRRSSVVITIDDGTADLTEHALPALERAGLPSTVYLATRFIDEQVDFPWGAPPASWPALRDAASPLVTYASHTHGHWLLDRTSSQEVADDLDRSIDLIASHLDVHPVHFAYPKAIPPDPSSEVAVRRRFRSAALAGNRVNRAGDADLHRLARTPIQCSDGFDNFVAKACGGARLEGALRAAVSRARLRGATR